MPEYKNTMVQANFRLSFLVSVRLVGGRTHHEGLAIDRTYVSTLYPLFIRTKIFA